MSGRSLSAFEAHRHPPFAPGNGAAEKHGAQVAAWKLEPRVLELADELRPQVPGFQPGDEVLLRTLCLVLARLERANEWIAEQPSIIVGKRGEVLGVVKLCAAWENQIHKLCGSLGLSPASRGKLASDAANASTSRLLAQHLEDTYGGDE